jgi:hypothetical protein
MGMLLLILPGRKRPMVGALLASLIIAGCSENTAKQDVPEFSEEEVTEVQESLKTEANCYDVVDENTPMVDEEDSELHSTWCYYQDDESDETYIFNGDGEIIDGGLFAIVREDEETGETEILHGSRRNGEVTYHSTDENTPYLLPVPYDEAQLPQKARRRVEFSRSLSETFLQLDFKAKHWVEVDYTKNLYYVTQGTISSQLEEEKQPWVGWFWPFGSLTQRLSSPLRLYDRFIEAVTGERGQASEWENEVRPGNIAGGHCNGWAAASVLYPEPTESRKVPEINTRMSVKKLKGLLSASSFCVHWPFMGSDFICLLLKKKRVMSTQDYFTEFFCITSSKSKNPWRWITSQTIG